MKSILHTKVVDQGAIVTKENERVKFGPKDWHALFGWLVLIRFERKIPLVAGTNLVREKYIAGWWEGQAILLYLNGH